MDILLSVIIAVSLGVFFGFVVGGIKLLSKPKYTQKQIEKTSAISKKAASLVKYLTFLVLAQGLLWCVYFLIMGIADASQVDYATGMSQLIVSVLTIVSIAFAFFEFLRRKPS